MPGAAVEVRRQPIRVRLRHPRSCTAALCDTPSAGYVVWLEPGWTGLRMHSACLMHLTWAQALGGCLALHAREAPSMEALQAAVTAEIRRRRQSQYVRPAFTTVFFNATTATGTSSSW